MSFIASFLFLVIIILYDEYKTYQAKKKAAPGSRRRMAEFNAQMKKLKELQNKDYSHSANHRK